MAICSRSESSGHPILVTRPALSELPSARMRDETTSRRSPRGTRERKAVETVARRGPVHPPPRKSLPGGRLHPPAWKSLSGGRPNPGRVACPVRDCACLPSFRLSDRIVAAGRRRRAGRCNRRREMNCSADRRPGCISRLPRPAPPWRYRVWRPGYLFFGRLFCSMRAAVRRALPALAQHPSCLVTGLASGVRRCSRSLSFRLADGRKIVAVRRGRVDSCNRNCGKNYRFAGTPPRCTAGPPHRQHSGQTARSPPAALRRAAAGLSAAARRAASRGRDWPAP